MFVPTILGQGTLEQQAYWIGRAWNKEIIGTYAQVRLGIIIGLSPRWHWHSFINLVKN